MDSLTVGRERVFTGCDRAQAPLDSYITMLDERGQAMLEAGGLGTAMHEGSVMDPVLPVDRSKGSEFVEAIASVPADVRDATLQKLGSLAANADRTHEPEPLLRFIHSLLVTSRLSRDPGFVATMTAEPDRSLRRDVAEVLAEVEERHASRLA